MKNLWLVSLFLLISIVWTGTMEAHAATDGFYNLVQVAASWDGTDANRLAAPSADYDYTYGDETGLSYALPWSFSYYGTSYSQINLDTNGNVWFTASGFANSFNLADTGRGPVLAAWNNDLSSYYYGGVFVQHKINPERVVIEWQTETYTEEGYSLPNDLEAVIFPDGTIRLDYKLFTTAYAKDFGSGISRGDGSASINLTSNFGNVPTLSGRSFAIVPVPSVQLVSPTGITANPTPLLSYVLSNGGLGSVSVDGIIVNTVNGQNLDALSDGRHTVTVIATNDGGSAPASNSFTIDTTPPTIAVSGVGDGGFYNTTLAPRVVVTDANLSGSSVTLNGQPYVANTPIAAEGSYVLTVSASDLAGNNSTSNIGFVIDKTPPATDATLGQPQFVDNGMVTVSAQTALSISAADLGNPPSGLAGISYQFDNSQIANAYLAPITFAGLGDGVHALTYWAYDKAGNKEIPHTLTVTLDSTPPVVSANPKAGTYGANRNVTLTANEAATIYYTTDGTSPTTGSGVYRSPIPVPATAVLKYFAVDQVGNQSAIKTENYIIDTTPPVLTLSTLADGALTNCTPLNVAGTVMDDNGVASLTINGAAVPVSDAGAFSFPVTLQPGPNTITTVATDFAGNQSTDNRTVTLDQTAPVVTIQTPSDNSVTAVGQLELAGTVDKTAIVTIAVNGNPAQSAMMDGLGFVSSLALIPGYNTIVVNATDLAGNVSTLKRTVLYDDQKPTLAVTYPGQDITTSESSITIQGTTSDPLTAVGITVTMDGDSYYPQVVNGSFSQVLTFADQKTYAVTVTATNGAGSSVSVQRNVIYAPVISVLSIGAVVSPTNQASQVISGTREPGSTVDVACTTAVVGTVTYPTSTTWQAALSSMKLGDNIIVATSKDLSGSVSTTSATIVVQSQAPQVTVAATPANLWPPNHKMVPVVISGAATAHAAPIQSVSIAVVDQYGLYNYKNLKFGDTVMLEAWRNGADRDGRVYTINAVAIDAAGNTTTASTTVTVPHSSPP